MPEAPTPIFAEDFERGMANTAIGLESYTGEAPLSMTYTAHPTWLNGAWCNGIIGSFNSPASNGTVGCPPPVYAAWVNGLAQGMGAYHGTGGNEHVLVDTTIGGTFSAVTPAATLQTKAPIPLPASGRFVSFSVDVVVKCGGVIPQLRFFLLDQGNEIPAFGPGPAINPCTAPGGQNFDTSTGIGTVRVGTYAAGRGVLFSGDTAGLKLTNDAGGGNGNDYAVDRIRMLDATPSLDKAFAPDQIDTQSTSDLTFTVTNTTDLGEKAGWSFSDQLPSGLTVAGAGTSSCPNASIAAPQGASTINVSGDLGAGQQSCTVTVPVEGSAGGRYVNGPDQVSTTGLEEPEAATLIVRDVVGSTFCKGVPVSLLGEDILPSNAPTDPCATDDAALARIYRTSLGSLAKITGDVLASSAGFGVEGAPPSHGPSATAGVADLDIVVGTLKIVARGVESGASVGDTEYAIPGYDCRSPGTGKSRIAYLVVGTRTIAAGDQPLTIPLGIGTLRVNHTDAGPGRVVQRALWVDLPGDADVVVGESRAGCTYLP